MLRCVEVWPLWQSVLCDTTWAGCTFECRECGLLYFGGGRHHLRSVHWDAAPINPQPHRRMKPPPQRTHGRNAEALRRAFSEFLLLPTCIIFGFLLLAALTFALDRGEAAALLSLRALLRTYAFVDAQASAGVLSTIAQGLITITSITISLLLIALQQAASALTHQVYDQFLRNWRNQIYFGFFVGVSLYTLVTLASVGPLNPVIGAGVALTLTVFALYLLLVLFYTTVDQMRPAVIIEEIHRYTLAARQCQQVLLRRTRRTPQCQGAICLPVNAVKHGFVTLIDIDCIEAATKLAGSEVEVVLRVSIGDYVVFGQRLAEVMASEQADADSVAQVLEVAVHREGQRDLANDPLDGIEELETIAWTSISSAQSDPDAGVLTIYSLRDILARWSTASDDAARSTHAPVVYVDNVLPRLLSAFESLAVSASESMQHQSYAEVLRTFALLFDGLPGNMQSRAEDVILRSLSTLGDHVLTAELEAALTGLIDCLERAGRAQTAAAVLTAKAKLADSIGKLGARSTRPGLANGRGAD